MYTIAVGQLLASMALGLAPGVGIAQAVQPARYASASTTAASLLSRPAHLRVQGARLVTALQQLSQRSGVPLAYSPSLLPADKRVTCACDTATVNAALTTLLSGTVFTFLEGDGQVVLIPKSPPEEAPHAPARMFASTAQVDASSPTAAAADGSVRAAPATITGRVTDASLVPVPGAVVRLASAHLAATTDNNGMFRLVVPSDQVTERQDTLRVNRIGYRPAVVPFALRAGDITVNVMMQEVAIALEQVVVTGTAGNQTRAAQGAVVASIDAADVTAKAPVSTVTNVLTGRVAGVNVTSASGTLGAAPRINIRGATSISLSNAPLVFVDGVRVSSGSRQDVGGYHNLEGLGGQTVTALNDINPDDIESIEVVKGPAAATLYGADASAGVIQIITKKGRLGTRSFTQNITAEWNRIQPNFTPLAAYGTCSAAFVAPGGPDLCQGKAAGDVVSANPLVRDGVFHNGSLGSVEYNAHGGGDNYGYFVSGSINNETGTSANNSYDRATGRTSFNWAPTSTLRVDAMVGLSRNQYKIPEGDDANYGYLTQGEFFASPFAVSVGPDGKRTGGLPTPAEGLEAVLNQLTTTRLTPSAQIHYDPFNWLTNRLTVGADLSSTHGFTFFPKNDQNWYNGDQANGYVEDVQNPIHIYTVDYLGDIKTAFGHDDHISSDLSFGSQYINTENNYLAGVGIGLAANSSNLVSSASSTESHQDYSQAKSWGLFAQEQVGFGDVLFVQAGARVDRNSAFGHAYGAFFLPKVSASYVISKEPFWAHVAPFISTLRLRAAFGTTGRSPTPGASLRTYAPFPYVTPTGGVGPGVVQASPGNPDLKPERGTEFEGGLDMGFFHERAGLELTYYNKRTSDLLLRNPLAPSLAFLVNPYVNAGKVDNRGIEFTLHATPIDRDAVSWNATLTGNTLRNRLVGLGGIVIPDQAEISPDLTFRYTPGRPLAAWFSSKILSVDTAGGFATVTNEPVYIGPQLPTFTANLSNTVTLFHNLRLYALFTSQRGAKILNVTPLIQDLSGTSAGVNLPAGKGGYSKAEQIARFGPFKTVDGDPVGLVLDRYLQPTDFVRLQEVSATITLPTSLANRLHASGASITVGGRNLHLWKSSDFQGFDPEVLSNTANGGLDQLVNTEEFTVPPPRRWLVRLNVQF
ncbi:MAG TPA: SusC/RagA family TonB-linked outer membrane protein [Gemmatimonadaceae bacterium]|nr:SusC/RagA family TonB-linked outer membrane protein [Gemmatimonadaceae bacterium]